MSNTLNLEQYVSRRGLLLIGAGVATAAVIWSWSAHTRIQTASRGRPRTRSASLPMDDLLKPGPIADLTIGSPDAPITIVEYASLTCPACASFHNTVLPTLKQKYIDTGKVRLVFREFVLNEKDARAAMMARCVGGEKSLPLVSALFAKQEDWAPATTDFLSKLFALGQQVGVTRQSFGRCQQDEKLLKKLVALRDRGAAFGVDKTPTFFVNGTILAGATIEDFDKAIEPLLTR